MSIQFKYLYTRDISTNVPIFVYGAAINLEDGSIESDCTGYDVLRYPVAAEWLSSYIPGIELNVEGPRLVPTIASEINHNVGADITSTFNSIVKSGVPNVGESVARAVTEHFCGVPVQFASAVLEKYTKYWQYCHDTTALTSVGVNDYLICYPCYFNKGNVDAIHRFLFNINGCNLEEAADETNFGIGVIRTVTQNEYLPVGGAPLVLDVVEEKVTVGEPKSSVNTISSDEFTAFAAQVSGVVASTPTPTPVVSTPTPTPVASTSTPTPVASTPTPTPVASTPVPTPTPVASAPMMGSTIEALSMISPQSTPQTNGLPFVLPTYKQLSMLPTLVDDSLFAHHFPVVLPQPFDTATCKDFVSSLKPLKLGRMNAGGVVNSGKWTMNSAAYAAEIAQAGPLNILGRSANDSSELYGTELLIFEKLTELINESISIQDSLLPQLTQYLAYLIRTVTTHNWTCNGLFPTILKPEDLGGDDGDDDDGDSNSGSSGSKDDAIIGSEYFGINSYVDPKTGRTEVKKRGASSLYNIIASIVNKETEACIKGELLTNAIVQLLRAGDERPRSLMLTNGAKVNLALFEQVVNTDLVKDYVPLLTGVNNDKLFYYESLVNFIGTSWNVFVPVGLTLVKQLGNPKDPKADILYENNYVSIPEIIYAYKQGHHLIDGIEFDGTFSISNHLSEEMQDDKYILSADREINLEDVVNLCANEVTAFSNKITEFSAVDISKDINTNLSDAGIGLLSALNTYGVDTSVTAHIQDPQLPVGSKSELADVIGLSGLGKESIPMYLNLSLFKYHIEIVQDVSSEMVGEILQAKETNQKIDLAKLLNCYMKYMDAKGVTSAYSFYKAPKAPEPVAPVAPVTPVAPVSVPEPVVSPSAPEPIAPVSGMGMFTPVAPVAPVAPMAPEVPAVDSNDLILEDTVDMCDLIIEEPVVDEATVFLNVYNRFVRKIPEGVLPSVLLFERQQVADPTIAGGYKQVSMVKFLLYMDTDGSAIIQHKENYIPVNGVPLAGLTKTGATTAPVESICHKLIRNILADRKPNGIYVDNVDFITKAL